MISEDYRSKARELAQKLATTALHLGWREEELGQHKEMLGELATHIERHMMAHEDLLGMYLKK